MSPYKTNIDLTRQDSSPVVSGDRREEAKPYYEAQRKAIVAICASLSKSTAQFSGEDPTQKEVVSQQIGTYVEKYKRWLYSDVSTFLFGLSSEESGIFISNLDTLRHYARNKYVEASTDENSPAHKVEQLRLISKLVDKLFDHANLAQNQADAFQKNVDNFSAQFDTHIIPFEAKFSEEMNKQLISLIAIFTALSFIVFGGISSLDGIFNGANSIPILKLMIIGCIWSLCICNLVFFFLYFVAKLTKTEIRTSSNPNISFVQQHAFIFVVNYILIILLAGSCLLFYIDYSNSGSWFILVFQNYPKIATITSFALLFVAAIAPVGWLHHKKKRQPQN